jgi:hypothetical protein
LDDTAYISLLAASVAGFIFSTIDFKLMLKIAHGAIGLSMIAQRRASSGNSPFEHVFNGF